jgi:hypothetical protein
MVEPHYSNIKMTYILTNKRNIFLIIQILSQNLYFYCLINIFYYFCILKSKIQNPYDTY